ncbi:MAG: SAM-dependent chlorinase/fluorinase, partial [Proteobacteria bacterium]|nr:SAM-dependent chlorinase/fluorinase [Pseudomonadota bacterium]
MSIITLTTDFGLKDPYVGEMKGVILSINKSANIVDITHKVSPQDVMEGALTLSQAYPFFPEDTIHVAVVDPGVGSERRPVLINTGREIFIGPDNGIFTKVLQRGKVKRIIHLTNRKYFLNNISSTFHGRDVFAPVAAHLSSGVNANELGSEIDNPILLKLPFAIISGGKVTGELIYIDGYGNLISNITEEEIRSLEHEDSLIVKLNKRVIKGMKNTYSDVGAG